MNETITLYYVAILVADGEVTTTQHESKFLDRVEAEDVMGSMECGVFDDDYIKYVPTKIVYELEEEV